MIGKFKVGDRVRIVTRNYEPVFQVGDKGTIQLEFDSIVAGKRLYLVKMDKDHSASSGVVFSEDDIELDV